MVCSLDSLEAVASFHLPMVAFIAGAYIGQTEGIVGVIHPPLEDRELTPNGDGGPFAHLHHHFAGFRQHEAGFEENEAVVERYDSGLFLIESDTDFLTFCHQGFLTYLQIIQTFVDEVSIIHVPFISLDSELFFDHVIQRIGEHEGVGLRDLTSESKPNVTKGYDELV